MIRLGRQALGSVLVFSLLGAAGCERAIALATDVAARQEPEAEQSFRARAVRVADGDTLTVVDGHNQELAVRLAEIDAPERGQPWGNRAKQALTARVINREVLIKQVDTDRYGRIVGRVFVDGEDINRAMIQDGSAWAFRRYLTDQGLLATEASARQAHRGLWSMPETQIVPPWEWRQGVREGGGFDEAEPQSPPVRTVMVLQPRQSPVAGLRDSACGTKRLCREMSSCEEARFYLTQCGVTSLDGNGDGEPCEVLCGTATGF